MEIDHVFESQAAVGRATTHGWGRQSLRAQKYGQLLQHVA